MSELLVECEKVDRAWDELNLRTMTKIPMSAAHAEIFAKVRLKQIKRGLSNQPLIRLARFNAGVSDNLLVQAFSMHDYKVGKFVWPKNVHPEKEPENLPTRKLRKTIAYDCCLVAKALSGRGGKPRRKSQFRYGYQKNPDTIRLHPDGDRDGILSARFGNLPAGVVNPNHPALEKEEIKELLRLANFGEPHEREEKHFRLWEIGVIEAAPLNTLIIWGKHAMHASSSVPERGCHTYFLLHGFDFK